MIVVEIRGGKLSLCQVRNRSVQTEGSMGHINLLATSFFFVLKMAEIRTEYNFRSEKSFLIIKK